MRGAVYECGGDRGGRGRGRYRDDDEEADMCRGAKRHGALRSNGSSSPANLGAEMSASSEEGEPSLEDDDDQCAEDNGYDRSCPRGSGATAGSEEVEDAGEPGAALDGAESEAESRSCLGPGLR